METSPPKKPAEDGKSWLLIKHKDDWAGPIDITTFAPNSVKSGGRFRDILLQEAPDVWQSHKGAGTGSEAELRKIAEKVAALDEPEIEGGAVTPKATKARAKAAESNAAPESSPKPKKAAAKRGKA